jgi:hypothetical protein
MYVDTAVNVPRILGILDASTTLNRFLTLTHESKTAIGSLSAAIGHVDGALSLM